MRISEYSSIAESTASYNGRGKFLGLVYVLSGLAGEAGEVLNKFKKSIRDDNCEITEERRIELLYELGDVLWYVDRAAAEIESSLHEVAVMNNAKLLSRKERNKLGGDGDHR